MNNHQPNPPRLAAKLLLWFLRADLAEEVLGDLDEKFAQMTEQHSERRARWNYWRQVLLYLRPFAVKKSKFNYSNNPSMFKHNLLISYRSFLRFKSTFLINLIGLSSGLAASILIFLWVNDELSMDRFHENNDRLYQVMQNDPDNGVISTYTYMPGFLAKTLLSDFPDVENATMFLPPGFYGEGILSYGEKHLTAKEQFVDENFLKMLSFPLVEGEIDRVLKDKSNIVISEELAIKLFGTTDQVLGKTVSWSEEQIAKDFLVTGIFKDLPSTSSQQFDFLISYELFLDANRYMSEWGNNDPSCLITLNEGVSPEIFEAKIDSLITEKTEYSSNTLFLQKYSERHLHGSYKDGKVAGGRITYVRLFSLIAAMVLLIACINFMNLSTAKATGRMKEIGVKKALGAKRKALIGQYFTESFLVTLLGAVLALFLVALALPKFSMITGKDLKLVLDTEALVSLALITIVTGILAGSYPAIYLSGFKTVETLKGKMTRRFGDVWARKGLVVFQFGLSVILISIVLVISEQIDYIQSKQLGYDRENVLTFNNAGLAEANYPSLVNALENIPEVLATSTAGHNLTGNHGSTSYISWPGKTPEQRIDFTNLETSAGFIETMGIELVAGRTFERNRPNESSKIMFNEKAIEIMELQDPIGKIIKLWGRERQIIGIVKDFHTDSFYEAIEPTFIQAFDMSDKTLVKIQAGNHFKVIDSIEKVFKEFNPNIPFDFKFLDADYQAMYETEKRVSSLSKYFASIAIVISCLGLLGLTAFTAERRSKEIGIRKVLGARISGIVYLLSADMTRMVSLSLLVGLPISFIITRNWLAGFAFSIDLHWSFFVLSGLLTLGIAWLTVGVQSVKAAGANPVDSLRSE